MAGHSMLEDAPSSNGTGRPPEERAALGRVGVLPEAVETP